MNSLNQNCEPPLTLEAAGAWAGAAALDLLPLLARGANFFCEETKEAITHKVSKGAATNSDTHVHAEWSCKHFQGSPSAAHLANVLNAHGCRDGWLGRCNCSCLLPRRPAAAGCAGGALGSRWLSRYLLPPLTFLPGRALVRTAAQPPLALLRDRAAGSLHNKCPNRWRSGSVSSRYWQPARQCNSSARGFMPYSTTCIAHPGCRRSGLYRCVSAQCIVQGGHHKAERAAGAPPRGAAAAFRSLRLPLWPLCGLRRRQGWRGVHDFSREDMQITEGAQASSQLSSHTASPVS